MHERRDNVLGTDVLGNFRLALECANLNFPTLETFEMALMRSFKLLLTPWLPSCKSSRTLPMREPLCMERPAESRTEHNAPRAKQIRLPMDQWKIRVNDAYPAYVSWETYEQIQAMLRDNYAAYDRNKTRGVPRPGAALLHGIVYCGECGHKLVVQYKGGTRYLCNYLRQQYHVPVCQDI